MDKAKVDRVVKEVERKTNTYGYFDIYPDGFSKDDLLDADELACVILELENKGFKLNVGSSGRYISCKLIDEVESKKLIVDAFAKKNVLKNSLVAGQSQQGSSSINNHQVPQPSSCQCPSYELFARGCTCGKGN